MPATWNLAGRRMHAVQAAPNGVIDRDTVFRFRQDGRRVWADYAGGRVVRGFLVGLIEGARLRFRSCQLESLDNLAGGSFDGELRRSPAGRLQIVERFAWES